LAVIHVAIKDVVILVAIKDVEILFLANVNVFVATNVVIHAAVILAVTGVTDIR
jgi:hypothetical protein